MRNFNIRIFLRILSLVFDLGNIVPKSQAFKKIQLSYFSQGKNAIFEIFIILIELHDIQLNKKTKKLYSLFRENLRFQKCITILEYFVLSLCC